MLVIIIGLLCAVTIPTVVWVGRRIFSAREAPRT